jgi:c-di-GMP-binding flagellar brake protein YcgR
MIEEKQDIRLQVNDDIQVTVQRSLDEDPITCPSRVEDTDKSDYLISWPTDGGTRVPVQDGDVLLISFHKGGSVFDMEAFITASKKKPMPLVAVRPTSAARRVERRMYVRVAAEIDVELSTVNDVQFATRTVDISGGGFGILHSSPLPLGTLFHARLKIPQREQPLSVKAQVVQCARLEPSADHTYHIGFAIIDPAEAVRRQILSYVIRQQQESTS